VHSAAPADGARKPGGQGRQSCEPGAAAKLPGLQGVHAAEAHPGARLPGAQRRHVPLPAWLPGGQTWGFVV
jgi:hypothetical protein